MGRGSCGVCFLGLSSSAGDSCGGYSLVISGVQSPLIRVISLATLLITLLITTHEPPSGDWGLGFAVK